MWIHSHEKQKTKTNKKKKKKKKRKKKKPQLQTILIGVQDRPAPPTMFYVTWPVGVFRLVASLHPR